MVSVDLASAPVPALAPSRAAQYACRPCIGSIRGAGISIDGGTTKVVRSISGSLANPRYPMFSARKLDGAFIQQTLTGSHIFIVQTPADTMFSFCKGASLPLLT